MNQKEDLLMDIGIVSFTLVDLALFLDTHPTDRTAMEYFNHYVRIKNQLELLLIDILHTENPGHITLTGTNHENYETEQADVLTAYLKAHLCEALTLEQIGEACTMSVSKLKRLCNRQYGCAPITYLISLRILEAKRMIRETSMNFTQIAETLGFGSVHYFSKQFKDKTGVTPSEYAKSILEK